MDPSVVSVVKVKNCQYPGKEEFFRPSIRYPEYPFQELSKQENKVYSAVRESLRLLGLDKEHYGTADWNPFGEWIKPGMNVLIKPNLVTDYNRNPTGGTECLYTQPSVVAPVIDYIQIALQGSGKITVGDAPVQHCNFDDLIQNSGYQELVEYYKKKEISIELKDFRGLKSTVRNGLICQEIVEEAKGVVVDLGQESEFAHLDQEELEQLRITDYDPTILKKYHTKKRHEYCIAKCVLEADVIINMPKPKTHRLAGMTASLKNFVGANVRKEYLPHHTIGKYGDESNKNNSIRKLRTYLLDKKNRYEALGLKKRAKASVLCIRGTSLFLKLMGNRCGEGAWHGNHTISKTILDINKIIYYADKMGKMQNTPTKNILTIADMIVAGEKEGPLAPSPKAAGMIVAGSNPVCFDEVIAALMGFDPKKIPTLSSARKVKNYPLAERRIQPVISSNFEQYNAKKPSILSDSAIFPFEPSAGWKGYVEKKEARKKDWKAKNRTILFLISTLARGGAERVILQLARYFMNSDYHVVLATLSYVEQEYPVPEGLERVVLDRETKSQIRIFKVFNRGKKLRKLCKTIKPDAVISFMAVPNFYAVCSTIGLPIKTIISVRCDPNMEYQGLLFGNLIGRRLLPKADGCVFQTKEAQEWFPKKLQKKSKIIFNAVDESFFKIERKDNCKNIVTLGRLSEQKNQELLIRAFARIAEQYPEEKLLIYGKGERKEELNQRIAELNLKERVLLMGVTECPQEVLKEAKVFVLSSDYEGMPNALMEALAAGVPCVAANCPCGGSKMLIKNGINGFLVPIKKEKEMAEAISLLLSDSELRQRFSTEAKRMADQYKPEIVLKEWEEYIMEIIER